MPNLGDGGWQVAGDLYLRRFGTLPTPRDESALAVGGIRRTRKEFTMTENSSTGIPMFWVERPYFRGPGFPCGS